MRTEQISKKRVKVSLNMDVTVNTNLNHLITRVEIEDQKVPDGVVVRMAGLLQKIMKKDCKTKDWNYWGPKMLKQLRLTVPELENIAEAVGPCDHSEDVCRCGTLQVLEATKSLITSIQ